VGALLLFGWRGWIDPPWLAVMLPSFTLLAIAAAGGTSTRLQAGPAHAPNVSLRGVALAAVLCTVTTVVLALTYASGQDSSCDPTSKDASWAGVVGWLGLVSAGAAILLGLAGLAAHRWVVALLCVLVNLGALLYMVLSSGALC
jgi:hypothetical protein